VVDDATYEAYNVWGGRCLYGNNVGSRGPAFTAPGSGDTYGVYAFRVSFERPYLAVNTDDPVMARVKWQEYEKPFAQWLERYGIGVDYCTSRDLDLDVPSSEYRPLVFLPHHEYMTTSTRNNVAAFTNAGGNLAFFSGNTCWWQVRYEYDGNQVTCYKRAEFDPIASTEPWLTTVNWGYPPVNWSSSGVSPKDPASALTGVTWAYDVIFSPIPLSNQLSFQALDAQLNHWVFEGAVQRMLDGPYPLKTFGLTYEPYYRSVVASETDTTDGNTPENFVTLATAYWPPPPPPASAVGYGIVATMGLFQPNPCSTVFTAACINWTIGLSTPLATGEPPAMDQITYNVLTRLTNLALRANGATVTLSPNFNSYEFEGWGAANVLDGRRTSVYGVSEGISSGSFASPFTTLCIVVTLPFIRTFSKVILYPRSDGPNLGKGFPVNFTIDVWDGANWISRVVCTDYPTPTTADGEVFTWGRTDTTNMIRINATVLSLVDGYRLQFAEIEVY
jgi:hypothetical protein